MVAGLWAVRQQHARESERDAAELSLRASAAALRRQSVLLEQSQRAAQIGAWELDVASNELYWTAQTYRIHEVTPEDYTPSWESSLGFFASDSAPFIREAMRRALAHGESWDLELQLITFKNRRIWVRSTGAAEMVLGKATKVWGSFQDITQRRKSEEQIIRLAHYDELTGPRQPQPVQQPPVARDEPRRAQRRIARACCSSIWTASRPSTTRSATTSAMKCCRSWPGA